MNKEPDAFPKNAILADTLRPLLGDSIFTTNGAQWRRQRQMMSAAFAQTALRKAFPMMEHSVKDMLQRFDTLAASDDAAHIDTEMTHVTADIIFRTILSHPLEAKKADIIFTAFNEFQERAMKIMTGHGYFKPVGKLRKANVTCANIIRRTLAPDVERRHDTFRSGVSAEHNDILQALLEAKDSDDGSVFTAQELTDQVSMLFLAGHETSASALTWALYIAAACPHYQEQLHAEAIATDGTFESLRALSFTKDFFRETLRLYPPVGFFLRESVKATRIRTHNVKKGASVFISPWLLHRCPREWEDPHVFRPERFSEHTVKDSVNHAYIPFGSGSRVCIGMGFATQEALLILSALIRRYRFIVTPGHTPMPAGRVTVRPEHGVYLQVEER